MKVQEQKQGEHVAMVAALAVLRGREGHSGGQKEAVGVQEG